MWATGIDQGMFIHELALRILDVDSLIGFTAETGRILHCQSKSIGRKVVSGQVRSGHVVRSRVYTGIIVKWRKWWWHCKDFLLELYRDWYFDINELLMYTDNIGNGHGESLDWIFKWWVVSVVTLAHTHNSLGECEVISQKYIIFWERLTGDIVVFPMPAECSTRDYTSKIMDQLFSTEIMEQSSVHVLWILRIL